ncbi:putative membrane protein [Chishuiella changwenlii]|jgi:putative membrane protein|uniref:Membrane protein n=1 Tax=Chishuiella changwenlii TaxID=1434701 RepID=A0A1M6YHM4_9FLAO|nr:phage holin family protein [Chishuiella changwenlii]GGE97234.1 membrane protein [Chishuiella changwenlii]SHL17613.1 putative membrane protein [Chishuiella changwenlii]
MGFIINLLVSALVVFGLANILPGVSIKGYGSAIIVALVIGLLNAVVKPILSFISFPITVLTLGLFSLVITAIIILLASAIMGDSFHVDGFLYALIFGVVLAIVNSLIGGMLGD